MATQFTGALSNKRKADLIEIASALGLAETKGNVTEIRERIQIKLDRDADTLKDDPAFKGLYGRRRYQTTDSDSPTPAEKTPARPRKSLTKVDRLAEAANIPLPDSPAAALKETVDHSLSVVEGEARDALAQLSEQLAPAVAFFDKRKETVDGLIRQARDVLSAPKGLVYASLAIEWAFLVAHVADFDKHTWFFPPLASNPVAAVVNGAFFWAPRTGVTFTTPSLSNFGRHSHLVPAAIWWFAATILPALSLSTLISFVPQKGGAMRRSTRSTSAHPTPTVDPLTFAIIRLFALLFPLTSAAPGWLADVLEVSGDAQGRALGAALLAALLLAERLTNRS